MSPRAEALLTDPVIGRLRRMRIALGWSLVTAAERAGMSVAAVGSYERGEREASFSRMRGLVNCYGYELVATSPEEFVVPLRQPDASAWAEWVVVLPDSKTVIPARDQGHAALIQGQVPLSALAHRVHRVSPLIR